MDVKIVFKHLEHTESLDDLIKKKSEHFKKFLEGKINVNWVCSLTDGEHLAEVKIQGPNCLFFAKAHSDTMYKSIDLAIDKIEKQVIKQKDKWKNHIHDQKGAGNNEYMTDEDGAWADHDDD